MAATIAASQAILKRRYANGVPRATFQDFPLLASVEKHEDFDGDDWAVPIITENPQGVGASIGKAQEALAQSTFARFLMTRVEYFGVARIKGQALRAATKKGGGALVDLWVNEMDGITKTVMKLFEIFLFGTGNAVLGTISSGSAGVTITLTVVEDINNFDLGGRYGGVSSTTLSPTIRSGSVVITAIDRSAGTATAAAAWNAGIAALVDGDSLVRAGTSGTDGSVSVVPFGLRQLLIGGSSPGTLYSQSRNGDPVRLAGQTSSLTGIPMEGAIIDLESLITIQGFTGKKTLWCNPRDVRQLKKSLGGKVTYPRATVQAAGTAGISFEAMQFEGDNGTINVMTSPFCPIQNVFLVDMSTFGLYSAGGAPMILDFDGKDFLRVSNDDAYEVRVGSYLNSVINCPVKSARGTGWGA